jgi:hypothetical protein
VCAPLEHEAGVPEDEEGEDDGHCSESRPAGTEDSSEVLEENGKAENEERRERDEKAVAVGRDAGPVGATGDEKIKGKKGGQKQRPGAALPLPENKKGRR